MKQRVFRIGFLILVSSCLGCMTYCIHPISLVLADPFQIQELELKKLLEEGSVVWVDARLESDFNQAHIENSILLNEENWDAYFPNLLDAWDPDKTIVVYCEGRSCDRSKEVASRLRVEMAVEAIYFLKGDWRNY